jgi:hypothetical protein
MRLITRKRMTGASGTAVPGSGYRWIALSNTTLGTLMATINGSITLIALPDIFRGIGGEPAAAGQRQPAAVADPGLPADHSGAGGDLRPAGRHVRPGADLQPGFRGVLAGITYGIQPYGGHTTGWTNPWVITGIAGGIAMLGAFCAVEARAAHPMFNMTLFRIRAFWAGNLASLLAALGRGGLMFILIIWLQGIYLPLHGYSFRQTPLWAGIAMLPLTIGFLAAGPVSGALSDRSGARLFTTGGMIITAVSFLLLDLLPVNFAYWQFALILLLAGAGRDCSAPRTGPRS